MKFLTLLLIGLFVLPAVFAADFDINLSKTSYSSGETAWGQITVNNVTLNSELASTDLVLMQGETTISITKIMIPVSKNTYFFYLETPTLNDGNYNLKLKDVTYVKNGVMNKGTFSTEFKVENKNQTIYVWPAVFFSEFLDKENPIFKDVIVKNVGWEKRRFMISVSNDTLVNSIIPFDFNLVGQSLNWITLRTNVQDYTPGFRTAMITIVTDANEKYEYPLILKKKWYAGEFYWNTPMTNTTIVENNTPVNISNGTVANTTNVSVPNITYVYPNDSLRFIDPVYKVINQTLKYKSEKVGVDWTLKNFAEQPLHNLTYELSGDLSEIVKVNFTSNTTILNPGQEFNLNVGVYPNLSTKARYGGFLTVYANENVKDTVEFSINFVNETVTTPINGTVIPVINTTKPVINNTPVVEEKSNSSAILIVLVIIVIIGIVGLIFYKKSRPKKERLDDYLQGLRK